MDRYVIKNKNDSNKRCLMIKRAHNFNEVKALVKESINNGTIYDLDDTQWVTHETEMHIADIYINKNSEVMVRTYNHTAGSINYEVLGKVIG